MVYLCCNLGFSSNGGVSLFSFVSIFCCVFIRVLQVRRLSPNGLPDISSRYPFCGRRVISEHDAMWVFRCVGEYSHDWNFSEFISVFHFSEHSSIDFKLFWRLTTTMFGDPCLQILEPLSLWMWQPPQSHLSTYLLSYIICIEFIIKDPRMYTENSEYQNYRDRGERRIFHRASVLRWVISNVVWDARFFIFHRGEILSKVLHLNL